MKSYETTIIKSFISDKLGKTINEFQSKIIVFNLEQQVFTSIFFILIKCQVAEDVKDKKKIRCVIILFISYE
jgi:hypothetical protein